MNTESKPNSSLIVAAFGDLFQADQALIGMIKLQSEQLIDLEDAVVAYKSKEGRTRIKQTVDVTEGQGASAGGWLGMLVGLVIGGPIGGALGGLISGAVIGALFARLTDLGIEDNFIKEVADELQPGTSALFVLSRQRPPDALIEELKRYDAKILKTNLHPLFEARIRQALGDITVDDDAEEAEPSAADTPAEG